MYSTFKCESLKHKMLDKNIGESFHNLQVEKTIQNMTINKPETNKQKG